MMIAFQYEKMPVVRKRFYKVKNELILPLLIHYCIIAPLGGDSSYHVQTNVSVRRGMIEGLAYIVYIRRGIDFL